MFTFWTLMAFLPPHLATWNAGISLHSSMPDLTFSFPSFWTTRVICCRTSGGHISMSSQGFVTRLDGSPCLTITDNNLK